jgi:hypothetical protein
MTEAEVAIAELRAAQRHLDSPGKTDEHPSTSAEVEKNASAAANPANCHSQIDVTITYTNREAVMASRRLWEQYQNVAAEIYDRPSERSSKSRFAERHHLSEREFRRAFSLVDKRGLGAVPRARYNAVIREVTETLRRTLKESPGTRRDSPSMRWKRAV